MKLSELKVGQSARIETVGGEGALRQHLLDMGMIPGAELTLVQFAPMGDPMEVRIHGYELTLRIAEAKEIEVATLSSTNANNPSPLTLRSTLASLRSSGQKNFSFLIFSITSR